MSTKKQPRRKRLHLYLLNDDAMPFEYVVNTLVTMCNHNTLQAEQCALTTHTTGQSHILSALGLEAVLIYDVLRKQGLNVKLVDKKL
jgi:ATP-dependent Clp protease adaptor protein ClpS|tara:strand:+ start:284 stop:544 length:261 start_codon:yes stop_codon:yes gene_type:complete